MENFTITEDFDNQRLDRALAALVPELSRTRIKGLIEKGEVLVDDAKPKSASMPVVTGQIVSLNVPEPENAEPEPQDIPLNIVFEDEHVIVINKAVGMVVHPAAGHADGTLVNALLYHCGDTLSGIGGVKRPGIVHRLDKDTSGLMLVAKNDHAHAHLSEQLSTREMSRTYQALVWGNPMPPIGVIDAPLARHPHNRYFMSVREDGREARTHYQVLENFGETAALVECKLETGRTHQIRVHMKHIRMPIMGDPLYGLQKTGVNGFLKRGGYDDEQADVIRGFSRQALHAHKLAFIHPVTEERMEFVAETPNDFSELKEKLSI